MSCLPINAAILGAFTRKVFLICHLHLLYFSALSFCAIASPNLYGNENSPEYRNETYGTQEISLRTTYGIQQPNNDEIAAKYRNGNGNKKERIIVLREPFRDDGILPYTKFPNDKDTPKSITIISTPGEYEPASFVIQAGNHKLDSVSVKVSDLVRINGDKIIPASAIDIRLVKVWFQSSDVMRRENKSSPKVLVPELLVHDHNIVKVDSEKQTNSIRTVPSIRDTTTLQPFSVAKNSNQQIWVTLLTPEGSTPGVYSGTIIVEALRQNADKYTRSIGIKVRVLPFELEQTPILMGQFYLARLTKPKFTYYNARGKSQRQMLSELNDMKRHGVNFITLDHNYQDKSESTSSNLILAKQIRLIKKSGITDKPIVYVDWKVVGQSSASQYQNKVNTINNIFNSEGITEFWIYNKDEEKLSNLKDTFHTFDAAHHVGSKNIVAVTNPSIAKQLKTHLDYALIQNRTPKKVVDDLKNSGVIPIAYGLPHAGEEKPATTRYIYGFALIEKGFAGTLSYAYQSGACWDDWMNWGKSNYRPNVMAYPTINEPIPTLQWEGWREGADDLKYLATYAKISGKSTQEVLNKISSLNIKTSDAIRQYLIEKTLELYK